MARKRIDRLTPGDTTDGPQNNVRKALAGKMASKRPKQKVTLGRKRTLPPGLAAHEFKRKH